MEKPKYRLGVSNHLASALVMSLQKMSLNTNFPSTNKSPCIDMSFFKQHIFEKKFTVKFTESYSLKIKAKLFYSKNFNYL